MIFVYRKIYKIYTLLFPTFKFSQKNKKIDDFNNLMKIFKKIFVKMFMKIYTNFILNLILIKVFNLYFKIF